MWFRVDLVRVHESWARVAGFWTWTLSLLLCRTCGEFLGHLSFARSSLLPFGSITGLSGLFPRGITMLLPHCSGLLTAFSSQFQSFGFTICLSHFDPLGSSRNKLGMDKIRWCCMTTLNLKTLSLLCTGTVTNCHFLLLATPVLWSWLCFIHTFILWIAFPNTSEFSFRFIFFP